MSIQYLPRAWEQLQIWGKSFFPSNSYLFCCEFQNAVYAYQHSPWGGGAANVFFCSSSSLPWIPGCLDVMQFSHGFFILCFCFSTWDSLIIRFSCDYFPLFFWFFILDFLIYCEFLDMLHLLYKVFLLYFCFSILISLIVYISCGSFPLFLSFSILTFLICCIFT